jgi:hypothetical protein
MNCLCSIKDKNNKRPICDLIIEMPNWMPILSNSPDQIMIGKHFSDLTLLGPFYKFSSFASDDTKFAQHFFMDNIDSESYAKEINIIATPIRYSLKEARVC